MNLDKLNQSLVLFANVGVIAGIFFLAVEVNQNTEMMRSQTRDAITEKQFDFYLTLGTDPVAMEIYLKYREDLDEVPEELIEGQAALFMALSSLRLWENEWYQYEQGLFEEAEYLVRRNVVGRIINTPGYRQVWDNMKGDFSPGFRREIDGLLE